MKHVFGIAALLLTLITAGPAQQQATKPELGGDITGLYSFVHEGEFVQIEVNEGKVTGLVSRFKNEDMDKAEFVDQYFEQASLEDSTLKFRTKPDPEHGVWFEFSGRVERGPAKTPSDEGYWTVKGTLTEHADGKATGKVHELTLKSFPEDAELDALPRTETQGTNDKK
jgi:hypothetical protein